MNRKIITALCLSLWIFNPAHAGYRDLKNEYDSYSPPDYFEDQFQPTPEREKPAVDKDFSMEIERIESMKASWKTALTIGEEKGAFFRPDPALLNSSKPAGTDAGAAADYMKRSYSLKNLEILTLLRNPGIKAAESRFRAALEAFSQVAALDEILREYTAFTEDLMTGVGPMKGKAPMRSKFPFPGVLGLKGQIVNQQVLTERESLEAVRRDAITEIRKAYWKLVYVIRATRITAEMLELLKHLEQVANTRYEAGKTSYQDVIKVRINRETMEEDLTTLRERRRNVEAKIREVINLLPDVDLGSPKLIRSPEKIPSLSKLYDVAQRRRQELLRLRAMVGKTERMIEMAETMILPTFTLNFSLYEDEAVNMVGSIAEKDPFSIRTEVSTGAGLPKMPWYGTKDAYLRETWQKLSALKEELNQAEVSTHTMVRDAWFELDRARRETALYYDDVVQLSRSALDVSTRGYESGNVSFADVIDSYTIWLRANLMLERNRSDLGIAWAKLEQVVGVSLK